MKASFENSVSVLVRAYMNDTLQHCNCSACAVGNLIFAARPHSGSMTMYSGWPRVFMTDLSKDKNKEQIIREKEYKDEARLQIDSTGYTWKELAKIEYAFEMADVGKGDDEWMFNGLMAVVDVLAEIHGIDLSTKEAAIGQFKEVQLSKA